MRKIVLICGFALVTVAAALPAMAQGDADTPEGERFHVELATMWWWASPTFELQSGSLADTGVSTVDFTTTFGLTRERFSDLRVVGKIARKHRLRFSYLPIRYEQSAVLSLPITFDDRVFRGPASASIKWDLWRFGYQWNFITRPRGFLGLIGELKYNDFDAAASAGVVGAAQDVRAPIPTVGVAGRAYVHPNVAISGEFSGLKIPQNNSFGGSFFDLDISATANVGRHFGVQGGYRAVSTDYLIDLDRGNLAVKGVYVGVVSRF
jgi:hypothetical protein